MLKTSLVMIAMGVASMAYAQTPTEFIKKVYADHLNDDLMGIDTVKLHAAPQLRRLINQRDAIAEAHEGEMCEWMENELIPGNDFDTQLKQMRFTQLHNGRIRASGHNFGEAFQVDFSVQCNASADIDACKINDLYNPSSYKKELTSIVRRNVC